MHILQHCQSAAALMLYQHVVIAISSSQALIVKQVLGHDEKENSSVGGNQRKGVASQKRISASAHPQVPSVMMIEMTLIFMWL